MAAPGFVKTISLVVVTGLLLGAGACWHKRSTSPGASELAPPAATVTSEPDVARSRRCFSTVAEDNSPSTQALFDTRHCQGGGVTWAAIVEVLLRRRGPSEAVEEVTPGWTGDVRVLSWKGGRTRVGIDVEGDAVQVCADSHRLLDEIQSDVNRLNALRPELERAMAEADPTALECFGDER